MGKFKVGNKVVIEAEVTRVDDNDKTVLISTGVNTDVWFRQDNVKHAEKPFEPREMLVWDNKYDRESDADKRFIVGFFDGKYMAKTNDRKLLGLWDNAKEVPKELENGKVSDEQLLKTFEQWLKQIKK